MKKEKLSLMVKWQVKDGHFDEVLEYLKEMVAKSKKEPGNLVYEAHQPLDASNAIYFYEVYTDADAFAAHVSSAHYQEIVAKRIIPLLEEREVVKLKPLFSDID